MGLPPPPEPAPRPRPEVNMGRSRGWTGRRSGGEGAQSDGKADKVSESRAAQAAFCARRKVGAASGGGGG